MKPTTHLLSGPTGSQLEPASLLRSWPGVALLAVLAVAAGQSRSLGEFLAVALVFSPAAFALLAGAVRLGQRSLARAAERAAPAEECEPAGR